MKNIFRKRKAAVGKKGRPYSRDRVIICALFCSGYFFSLIVFLLSLLLSVAGIVVSALAVKEAKGNFSDIAKLLFSIAGAVATAYGTVRSLLGLKHKYFDTKYVKVHEKNESLEKIEGNLPPPLRKAGYRVASCGGKFFYYSDPVDDHIYLDSSKIDFYREHGRARLISAYRAALIPTYRYKFRAGTVVYNEKHLKQKTDIYPDTQCVFVIVVSYNLHLVTNGMFSSRVVNMYSGEVVLGNEATVDKNGDLLTFEESSAANIIGVSTLAVTSDGYAIINKQNKKADINGGCLIPSGSGSADVEDLIVFPDPTEIQTAKEEKAKAEEALENIRRNSLAVIKCYEQEGAQDAKKALDASEEYHKAQNRVENAKKRYREAKAAYGYRKTLFDFLTHAMERELFEETHIPKQYVICSFPAGLILNRSLGAKPDYIGITLLSCDKESANEAFIRGKLKWEYSEIKKRHAVRDYTEIDSILFVPIGEIEKATDITSIPALQGEEISVQLFRALQLLQKHIDIVKASLSDTE